MHPIDPRDAETAARLMDDHFYIRGGFPTGENAIAAALSAARREGEAKKEAEAAVLRAALLKAEYCVSEPGEQDSCPVCRRWKSYGHQEDCSTALALSSTTAGSDFLKRLDDVCEAVAAAYQIAGALDAPVEVLDNLSDVANGEPLRHTWEAAQNAAANVLKRLSDAEREAKAKRSGFYVASRATVAERGKMWRALREQGVQINSSWIDEDDEGQTTDFSALWVRICSEVCKSEALIFYAETGDFPLKGAYVEIGMALAVGIRVYVVLPGVELEPRSQRPVGSWLNHPLVQIKSSVIEAVEAAMQKDSPKDSQ